MREPCPWNRKPWNEVSASKTLTPAHGFVSGRQGRFRVTVTGSVSREPSPCGRRDQASPPALPEVPAFGLSRSYLSIAWAGADQSTSPRLASISRVRTTIE